MYQVYLCLTQQHDYRLVALAALICVSAVFTQFRLLRSLAGRRGPYRTVWIGVTAVVTAIGVWATHFVAMLAFDPGMPMSYDPWQTSLSFLVAVGLTFAGLMIASREDSRWAPPLGGAVVGLAIGAMHYSGMAAVRTAGDFSWNSAIVTSSILVGVVMAMGAGEAYRRGKTLAHEVAAIALMTLAICSMHFTGMGALIIHPDPTVSIPPEAVSRAVLATVVAGTAVVILFLAVGATVLERRQKLGNERRLLELANAAVEGLAVCEEDRVVTVNAALEELLGLAAEDIIGRDFQTLMASGETFSPSLAPESASIETALRAANGDIVPVEVLARAMPFNGGARIGVAVRDLRMRRAAESRIRFLAHSDSLTGLANRASFSERLEVEMQRHRRKSDGFAVLCLDLDRFKQVNDVFGHAAGDAALITTAKRIGELLEEGDVFARLGGDEFAILRTERTSPAELARLSQNILASMAMEVDLGDHTARIGTSVGVALYPQDGSTPDTLMRSADAALYKAKNDGRGVYRFFEAQLGAELRERQAMEFDLRQAIARSELRVVYQPQTELRGAKVFGFEALVRWNSQARGEVSPSIFIPIAEESGLIVQIGEWVLREACREAASWPMPLQIAVNLSGVQLRTPNLAGQVCQILLDTGLKPDRLELEITETALVDDFTRALHTLRQIKALGVKVAMDDFGTGYSSLSNLRAFPFDKLKIDQSFVRNVHGSEEASTIVRAIVGLARGLNLKVLAEGVETVEEMAFLDQELCTEAQGYLFGRPSDIADFAREVGREPGATQAIAAGERAQAGERKAKTRRSKAA